jgi:hypothetical protein
MKDLDIRVPVPAWNPSERAHCCGRLNMYTELLSKAIEEESPR